MKSGLLTTLRYHLNNKVFTTVTILNLTVGGVGTFMRKYGQSKFFKRKK
jgi:hypothetical protein